MAAIGQQLTSPEPGWKRYDDTYPTIQYHGTWTKDTSNPAHYHTSEMLSITIGSKVVVRFRGTALRLMGSYWSTCSDDIDAYIDGLFDKKFSQEGSGVRTVLSYEINGLRDDFHEIVFINNKAAHLSVDAIDINASGRLFHPDEVLTPSELTVGKRIRCHYEAATPNEVGHFSHLGEERYQNGITDFIPAESSGTPNGDFYWIMVDDWNGKYRLIADRNIQHSISWDRLNREGIVATGMSFIHEESFVPKMTDFSSSTGKVIYSSNYGSGWDVWHAFDGVTNGNISSVGIINFSPYPQDNFIGFRFNEPKVVNSVLVNTGSSGNYAENSHPKDFDIQAWNGTEWITLHQVRRDKAFELYMTERYYFDNKTGYTAYRLGNITNGGNPNYISFSEIKFMYSKPHEGSIVRLMTGGVELTDKDNEWDKYIVNSNLNGVLTGDRKKFWNIGIPIGTNLEPQVWTASTPHNNSSVRVCRGRAKIDNWTADASIQIVNIYTVFRPMLEFDISSIKLPQSFLVEDAGVIKTFSVDNNAWKELGPAPVTANMFGDGMMNISLIVENISHLSNQFKVVTISDSDIALRIQFEPSDVLMMQHTDISIENVYAIDYFRVTGWLPDSSRIIVSFDKGITWKTNINGEWKDVLPTVDATKLHGMTSTVFNNLNRFDWDAVRGEAKTVRFGFLLSGNQIGYPVIDDLISQVDMAGRWMRARDAQWEYITNKHLKVSVYCDGDYKIIY